MKCEVFEPNFGKRTNRYKALWHIDEFWELPKEDRIIVAQLQEKINIVVRVDSNLCTDEIVAWAYLGDLI